MSFGFSPSDIVKLLEISTRVYIAFKDANENSEAQVEALVREFTTFAELLLELDELMKEFGRPLPFPVEDFKKTLKKCDACLKPYKENLVDKKMSVTKVVYTIKYIGKEKELDGLRKQISGHYQALNFCLSFLQLRLNLEQTKRSQRLLVEPRHRATSLGGQWYTSDVVGASSSAAPLALPSSEETHPLYKDYDIFNRWLKSEDERVMVEAGLTRPLSLGDDPPVSSSVDADQTAAILYHLRREVDDAIMIEENRAKRAAVGKRVHLAPSDAMKSKVKSMPPAPKRKAPTRTYTLDTNHSGDFSRFSPRQSMSGSTATIRPGPNTPSPKTSPLSSPRVESSYFATCEPRSHGSPMASPDLDRTSSVSSYRDSISTSAGRLSVDGLGITTAETTPDSTFARTIRPRPSAGSLVTIHIGEGALEWKSLCRKVQVERKSRDRDRTIIEDKECDMFWRYREDAGISLRALYRSSKENKIKCWTVQSFPATGPSIPLSTSYSDGEVSIDFPRGSFGKLDKNWVDIKYTFANTESSTKFQTLLYTNNGRDEAELLFDRPVLTVSSDKNRPECRGRNIRLWRKSEMHTENDGHVIVDVLVLLFYTSALEDKGHWVEEPHYAFEWLTDPVYNKDGIEKLSLFFSKDPSKWISDKLFRRRKSSKGVENDTTSQSPNRSKGKSPIDIPSLRRSGTAESHASSSASIRSSQSIFGFGKGPSRIGNLNRFGYSKLDIEFQSSRDRRDFLDIWKKYVRPLGGT